MEKEYDVLCIGIIVSDILMKPVELGFWQFDGVKVDECKHMPGGDALNEAVILARLGARVGLIGAVGSDIMGQALLYRLREEGVNTDQVKIRSDISTSTSIVLIRGNGERSFIYYAGGNEVFSVGDMDLSGIQKSRVVSIGSLFGLFALDGEGAEVIFREARARDVITVADTVSDIRGIGLQGIKGVLEHTDYFIPSLTEARALPEKVIPVKWRMCF